MHLLGPVWVGLTLVTEAVRCEVVSIHTQNYTNRSRHVVVKKWNTTTVSSVVLQLGQNIGTDVNFYSQQQSNLCVWLWVTTLRNTAILQLDTLNFTSGMNASLSDISYNRAEEVSLYKCLLSLRNERSWIWTACRSTVFHNMRPINLL